MTIATTYSRAQIGVEAPLVIVEADITSGLPQIVIVGLPETAVKESKDRVKAALINSGFTLPSRRVTINLAPADLPKQGGRYDLAIALAVLAASEQIPSELIEEKEFLGELSLSGELRGVNGVLPAILKCKKDSRSIFVPNANQAEAALMQSAKPVIAASIIDVIQILRGKLTPVPPKPTPLGDPQEALLITDIKGQFLAKRALIIAASGCHNLLMSGPPGTGKTMLASRLPYLLPKMTEQQALAVAAVQSVSKLHFDSCAWGQRPFRNPHHTASAVALVGGGNPPMPGEISLANEGVLFLDELPEFSRHVLEVLREPLESGKIVISRAQHQVTYPARFQLISAMNPCPCGYYGEENNRCNCRVDQIERYRNKISGPLLDRIDLHVKVPPLAKGILTDTEVDTSEQISHAATIELIGKARQIMISRCNKPNAHLSSREVEKFCAVAANDRALLEHAMDKLGLSARGYFKILKVARTIADLSADATVSTPHIVEALAFRDVRSESVI